MTMRWSPMVFSIPHELGCRAVPSTGHRQQAGVGRIDLERRLYLQVDRSALAFVPPPSSSPASPHAGSPLRRASRAAGGGCDRLAYRVDLAPVRAAGDCAQNCLFLV